MGQCFSCVTRYAWPRIFYLQIKIKEVISLTDFEYENAIARLDEIACMLTLKIDEEAQDLFEEYCELQLEVYKAELFG